MGNIHSGTKRKSRRKGLDPNCTQCGDLITDKNIAIRTQTKHGRHSHCRPCLAAKQRIRDEGRNRGGKYRYGKEKGPGPSSDLSVTVVGNLLAW